MLSSKQKSIGSLEKALLDARKLETEAIAEIRSKVTTFRSEHDQQIDKVNVKLQRSEENCVQLRFQVVELTKQIEAMMDVSPA